VFEDQNRNGYPDAWPDAEPSIPGVLLTLSSSITATRIVTTSPLGTFGFFDLIAGATYTVTETDPKGYVSTTPNQVTVTMPEAGPGLKINFGDYRGVLLPLILSGGASP
jgi:hypothetical protein